MEQFGPDTRRDSVFWSMREEGGSATTRAATVTNRAYGVTIGKSEYR
jgi:hypothetical protein